jgi:hypothetical protein
MTGGTVTTEALFKLTSSEGEPVHGGKGSWSLPRGKRPGAWREVKGELVPCRNGLHLLRAQDIGTWLCEGVLWEVEAGTERIDHGDKIVVRKARLVRRAAVIDAKVLRLLACDFAEHVLPIFEKRRPGDLRPREAIAAARAYVRGEIGIGELREKRAAADAAAAYAAAAAAADAAAAYAAAAADAAAADAVAAYADRSKERAWQTARIVEVLGLASMQGAG